MTKSLKLHYKAVFKPKNRRAQVHFANFIPSGLPRFWTHFSVGVRHIARDYSVALIATGAVVIVVAGALFIRLSERSTLADLLLGGSNTSQGYATLLSKDKADELKRNTNNDQANPAPAGAPSSFALNPGGSSGSGGSTPGGGGGGTTPAQFSSSIASFQQIDNALECSGKINKPGCSKRYTFTAEIRTQNGPGVVSYGWRSNLTSSNEDNSFGAPSGNGLKVLQKEIVVPCLSPGTYSLRLDIFAPTATQSNTLNFDHNCVGI